MAVYNVSLYATDPRDVLSRRDGDFSEWTGAGATSGSATITDNGASGEDLFLTDGNRDETATADVSVGGYSATGVSVEAEQYWLLRDIISGETITVVRFNVDGGAQQYTLASQPLVQGRTYETLDYDNSPQTSQGTGFDYADFNDGTVLGTGGDDVIDRDYTGDPNGDKVDNNDLMTSQTSQQTFSWSNYVDNQNLAAGASQTAGGVQVTVSSSLPAGSTFTADTNGDFHAPPDSGISETSAGRFFANGNATDTTLTVDFDSTSPTASTEVHNVRFVLNDIDGVVNFANNFQDIVTIRAYDVDGNEIDVQIDVLGNDTVSGNTVTGALNSDQPSEVDGAVLITIAGPVERVVITYDNGGNTQQAMFISDIDYDAITTQGNADSIDAGAGNDSVFAGSDDDTVLGGTGNDTIDGGSGADWLRGEAGADSLLGGSGNDTLDGGADNDVLNGGSGNDSLIGGTGVDTLDGGVGNDILSGGAGNDILIGAIGNDTLLGDDGADSLTFTGSDGVLDGGTGDDTIRAEGASNLVTGGDGADLISGGAGTETVDGGAGNDTILSSGNGDFLSGGDGADLFEMADGFGSDTLTGGEGGTDFDVVDFTDLSNAVNVTFSGPEAGGTTDGVDTLAFTEIEQFVLTDFDDSVTGSRGSENIIAGAGNDSVFGGAGSDSVDGGAGDDTIDGGDGADQLSGGADADTFVVTGTFGNDTINGGEDGNDVDVIDLSGLSGPVTVTYSGDEAGTITDGTSTITFSNVERLILTEFDDVVDATLDGIGTNIQGGGGADSVLGGSGSDTFDGGAGNDTLTGGSGSDIMVGGAGDDSLLVGSGDTATGNEGDDSFVVDPTNTAGGTITLIGGEGDETAGDSVDFNGNLSPGNITFTDPGQDGEATLDDGTAVTFSEMEAVICFAGGTHIATPHGPRPVEDLSTGDFVLTRDAGPQLLEWVGMRQGLVGRNMAPVLFQVGAIGNNAPLRVSPNHRMLIRGWRAQLMFGEEEVLVPAKALVNGSTIRTERPGLVSYFHLLTPKHEVIFAEGAEAETFLPGTEGLDGIDVQARARLFQARPELRADLTTYGRCARPTVRARVGHLLAG